MPSLIGIKANSVPLTETPIGVGVCAELVTHRKKKNIKLAAMVFGGRYNRISIVSPVRRVHPPQLDQRRLVVPVINLRAHAVGAFDDSADDAFDEPPRVQGHSDAVTDFERVLWLLAGHGGEQYSGVTLTHRATQLLPDSRRYRNSILLNNQPVTTRTSRRRHSLFRFGHEAFPVRLGTTPQQQR
jgi:hypothetical protein